MNDLDLTIFVEFGVGIAGFSGVVVVFSMTGGRMGDYDRFRVAQLLFSSLVPAFLGLLPLTLAGFGIHGEAMWRIGSATVIALIVLGTIFALRSARAIAPEARRSLSPVIWRVSLTGHWAVLVWNAANLWGWPQPISQGPVIAAMVWLLICACLMFYRLLFARVGATDSR